MKLGSALELFAALVLDRSEGLALTRAREEEEEEVVLWLNSEEEEGLEQ